MTDRLLKHRVADEAVSRGTAHQVSNSDPPHVSRARVYDSGKLLVIIIALSVSQDATTVVPLRFFNEPL